MKAGVTYSNCNVLKGLIYIYSDKVMYLFQEKYYIHLEVTFIWSIGVV